MKIRRIQLPENLPFEADGKQLWYIVPDGYADLSLGGGGWRALRRRFSRAGYSLTVLNEVCDDLTGEMLSYNVPELEAGASALRLNLMKEQFEDALGCAISFPTFISFSGQTLFSHPSATLYGFPDDGFASHFADSFLEEMSPKGESAGSGVRFSKSSKRMEIILDKSFCQFDESIFGDVAMEMRPPADLSAPAAPANRPSALPTEEEMTEAIIERLAKVKDDALRALGLDESMLRFLVGKARRTYSRLHITRHAKIILEDYSGLEIVLDDKTKALYFLYLRHPEGIAIKDLPDFIDEALDLYMSISGRDNIGAMRQTVANLCDPLGNDANVSLSRIKRAFVEAFNNDLAKAYYIDGRRGETRRIALDRSLVIWDTIR